MSALMFHLLIFYSLHNNELIHYLILLDGEVVLANYGSTEPERYFIYCDHSYGIFLNDWI